MRRAEGCGQQAVPARDIGVAGDVVVEGRKGCKEARHQQKPRKHRDGRVGVDLGQHEEVDRRVRRAIRQGQPGDRLLQLVRPGARDHQPGGEDEEHPDHQDRKVGRARDGALGVAGFLAVDRGGLDPDEGPEAKEDGCRQGPRGQRGKVEDVDRKAFALGPASAKDGEVDDQDDQILKPHQDDHHLGRQVHLPVAQDADQKDGDQAVDPPVEVQAELAEDPGRNTAQKPDQAELHGVVGHQRHDRHRPAPAAAKSARGIGVEGACVDDMAAHRDVTGREGQHDQRQQDEGQRNPGPVPQKEGQRHRPRDPRQRGCSRDHHEGDGHQPQRIPSQPVRPDFGEVRHCSLRVARRPGLVARVSRCCGPAAEYLTV